MKRLLFIALLFVAFDSFSQPLNYTRIANRYRWISGMFDSALYVPRYNGTPSGVRVGENSAIDGAIAIDTANGRAYMYTGGAWVRLANYAEIPAAYTAGDGLLLTGNDFKVLTKRSITIDNDSVMLVNDTTANAPYHLYGFNIAGRRGFYRPDTTFISGFSTMVRPLISLTTTGSSGAATYNSATGVLNIPQYSGGLGTLDTLPYPQWTVVQDAGGTSYKTAGQRVFNVKDYGATGDGVTDDTRNIQAAINAAHANFGGIVYFPIGHYIIADTLRTTSVPGNPNSQLYIPLSPYSANTDSLRTIEFIGEVAPNYFSDPFADKDNPTTGVLIESTLRHSGAVFGSASETVYWGEYNFVRAGFKNMRIRVDTDSSGVTVGAKSTAIDGSKLAMATFSDLVIDIRNNYRSVLPESTAFGIKTPLESNFVLADLERVAVMGYYTGMTVNEHTDIKDCFIDICYNGLQFLNGNHASNIDHIIIARSKNIIRVSARCAINIQNLDVEFKDSTYGSPTSWWNTEYCMYNDATTYPEGIIRYNVVVSGVPYQTNSRWNWGGSANHFIQMIPGYSQATRTTTAQRSGTNGMIQYNETTDLLEYKNETGGWQTLGGNKANGAVYYNRSNTDPTLATTNMVYDEAATTLYLVTADAAVALSGGATSANSSYTIGTRSTTGGIRLAPSSTGLTVGPNVSLFATGSTYQGLHLDAGNASGADVVIHGDPAWGTETARFKQGTGGIALNPSGLNMGVAVGTTSANASALLDLTSTTRGALMPRMNTAQQNAIGTPATGLIIFNTDTAKLRLYNGSAWETIAGGGGGGAGTVTDFVFTDGSGFNGTVTTSTSTPTLALTTTLTTAAVPYIGASGALTESPSKMYYEVANSTLALVGNTSGSASSFPLQIRTSGGLQLAALRGDGAVIGTYVLTNDNATAAMNESYGAGLGFNLANNKYLSWSSDATWYGTKDLGLYRNAAGVMEINNGTAGTFRDLKLRGLTFTGRNLETQGADVASAAGAIALGTDGNTFEITGTAAITLISNSGWQNGAEINLVFTSTATLTDGTANSGTDIGMELAGNTNFTASADDIVTLVLTEVGGTQRWREKSRSVN